MRHKYLYLILAVLFPTTFHGEEIASIFHEDIFSLYDSKYDFNVEMLEYRAEYLFKIILSDSVTNFINDFAVAEKILQNKIIEDVAHPIADTINLDACIKNVEHSLSDTCAKKQIINNLIEAKNSFYSIASLAGSYHGLEGVQYVNLPRPRNAVFGAIRLELNSDGTCFYRKHFDLFNKICIGEWSVSNNMIHITCNRNPKTDSCSLINDFEIKILNTNQLQLKDSTSLWRNDIYKQLNAERDSLTAVKCAQIRDSIARVSRAKADAVLENFDTIQGKKILYNLKDKDYYIIIQTNGNYHEYIVATDSIGNISNCRKMGNDILIKKLESKKCLSKKKRKILERLKQNREIIINSFDISQYSTDLITMMPSEHDLTDTHSYFVLKDENCNRYGEYSRNVLTKPSAINEDLEIYLCVELITPTADLLNK